MIRDLDRTLEQLLRSELAGIDANQLEISFAQPSGEWVSRRGGRLTVNLFLYDVRENAALRRHQWQQGQEAANGGARTGAVSLKRTPLLLDCFYLVSAWSGADETKRAFDEHELLSLTIRALARYPVLNPPFEEKERAEVLAGARYQDASAHEAIQIERPIAGRKVAEHTVARRAWLNDPERNPLCAMAMEVRTRLAQHDVLTNPAEVWSALEAQMKAGVSFVVTLPFDPWEEVEALTVAESILRFGAAGHAPDAGELARFDLEAADQALHAVGGVIYDRFQRPQSDLKLRILHGALRESPSPAMVEQGEDRFATQTNARGEYHFSGLPAGAYTLLIRLPTGEIVVRELAISTTGPTGYDFTI